MKKASKAKLNVLLIKARKTKQWTQAEAADKIGCSSNVYSRWERGIEVPSPYYRDKLLKVFEKNNLEELGIFPQGRTMKLPSTSIDALEETIELLGREEDLKKVYAEFRRRDVRILTLIGPPGIGKTELAKKARIELEKDFDGCSCFIQLDATHDPERVLPTIAHKLGIADIQEQSVLERLQSYLHNKPFLFVLDNFESVTAAGKALEKLLKVCRKVKVLITSLSPLDVSGEQVILVPQLTLPYAIDLFNSHARSIQHDPIPSAEDARVIAKICDFLYGNPGLIILAARFVRAYPLKDILRCLEERPEDVLTEEVTDQPKLRRMFARLDKLLIENERRLLRRLSVFSGGFTKDAVENICILPDEAPTNIFHGIEVLTEKHFVVRDTNQRGGITRFKILDAYRPYAHDNLKESGEENLIEQQHYAYFFEKARQFEELELWPSQQEWRDQMEADIYNLRAALEWCLQEPNRTEAGLLLARALLWFWYMNGYWKEGLNWVRQLLETHPTAPLSLKVRAEGLYIAGFLGFYLGDYEAAKRWLDDSMKLFNELDDTTGLAQAQVMYAMSIGPRTPEEAKSMFVLLEGSVAMMRRLNNKWRLARSLLFFSCAVDRQTGHKLLEESRQLFEEVGEQHGIAWSYLNQGDIAWFEEKYSLAEDCYEESSIRLEQIDDRHGIAWSLGSLGNIMLRKGNLEEAVNLYTESLERCWKLGDDLGMHCCLVGIAELLRRVNLLEQAACLLGATNALYQKRAYLFLLRPHIIPHPSSTYDEIKANIRDRLDEKTEKTSKKKVRFRTPDEAKEFALAQLQDLLSRADLVP